MKSLLYLTKYNIYNETCWLFCFKYFHSNLDEISFDFTGKHLVQSIDDEVVFCVKVSYY